MSLTKRASRFKPGDLVYVPANVTLLQFRSPPGDPQRDVEMSELNEHPTFRTGPPIAVASNDKPKHVLVVAYDDTTRRYEVALDGAVWSVYHEDCSELET